LIELAKQIEAWNSGRIEGAVKEKMS
jgi:hypothetical protein